MRLREEKLIAIAIIEAFVDAFFRFSLCSLCPLC